MKKFLLVLSVCFIAFGQVLAQSQTISGTVRNAADDEPIIGASVQVKGTSKGTITDIDGKFSLSVAPNSVLVVSFIGMSTQEVAAKDGVVINLSEDTEVLDEVMVIGYGTATRAQFVGSAKEVKGEEFTNQAQANVTNALQGKMAGVQVVNSTGQPGSSASIRIRGTGSINGGTTPLYIVDGAPFEGSINSISSYDIASITVLKDAAATAIYGARGANGVVLITTKSGSTNTKFEVNVDAKWGNSQRAVGQYDVISDPGLFTELAYKALYNSRAYNGATAAEAYAYADRNLFGAAGLGYQVYTIPDGERLVGTNFKLNPHATLGYSDGQYYYTPDNWEAATLRTNNLRHEYNINVNGGNADTQFFLSAGYLNDPGIIAGSSFERFTIRGRIDSQVKKWLKVGGSFSYAHTDTHNPGGQTSDDWGSSGNLFYTMDNMGPIYPFYRRNADGTIQVDNNGYTIYDTGTNTNQTRPGNAPKGNPAMDLNINSKHSVMDNFAGNIYLTLTPVEGLNITARVAPNAINIRSNALYNPFYGSYVTVGGATSVSHSRIFTLDQQYMISYKRRFAQEHNLEILAGWEEYWYRGQSLSGYNDHLFNPFIDELGNAYGAQPTVNNVGSATQDAKTAGLFARLQYDLKDRYFLNATYRFEGSSNFAPKHRWGHFGSVGVAWLINKEGFMESVDWIDELKLKASWGTQGNDQVGTLPYMDFYDVSYNAETGEFSKTLHIPEGLNGTLKGNPDLRWESQMLSNVGFEFDFLKNRLGGSAEYFNRTSSDQLFLFEMPASAGFSYQYQNAGTVANNGLEIELYGTLVKTRNVEWEVNFNLTYINSKVVALPEVYKDGIRNATSIYREGGSLVEGYMIMYAGVDQATGQALYYADPESEKAAGNFDQSTWATTTDYSSAKKADLGDLAVKCYGGFGTTLNAYGIDLSIQCAYQFGGKGYDGTYLELMHSGDKLGHAWHKDILKAWTPENTNTNVPRLSSGDELTQQSCDRWLVSNDYLSLNNITLGYTLPKKWTKKAQMEKVRIFFQGDNLALWSARKGYDPRQGQNSRQRGMGQATNSGSMAYSQLRTLSGGISVTF